MQERALIRIAGVTLAVRSPLPLCWEDRRNAYRGFRLEDAAAGGDPHVPVDIAVGPVPALAEAGRFDAGPWQVGGNAGRRCFLRPGVRSSEPLWRAELRTEPLSVYITCAPRMVGERGLICPLRYPLDQLLVVELLAPGGGFLVHAAGADVGGCGILLPGVSGAGKTTLSRLLLADGAARLLSDDRVIVRRRPDGLMAMYGTPWCGDADIAVNDCLPLKAVVFVEKADRHDVACLPVPEALKRLLPVVTVPWYDQDLADQVLDSCGRLLRTVPGFRLRFAKNRGALAALSSMAAAMPGGG